MSVLCAPAPFLLLPLWEGCFLYVWVHECSLCSCSISTPSFVGRMFSVLLGSWVFTVLQQHFYPFLCGKDVFNTSGFMDVLCAPPAFLPLLLWEGCFLYLWVHECSLCSSSIYTPPSVGRMFSVLLGSWVFSVLQQHFYPFLCGKDVFSTSVFMSVLCAPSAFLPFFCGNNVFYTSGFMSVLYVFCTSGFMSVLCAQAAFLPLPLCG